MSAFSSLGLLLACAVWLGVGAQSVVGAQTMAPKAAKQAQLVNINKASIAELDKLELPGTKPALSERIQGGRPYQKIGDLVSKKVISPAELSLIKNLITIQ